MCPVLFQWGKFTIYSYGAMLAIGFMLAVFLASRQAKNLGLKKDLVLDVAFILIISGLIGARIVFVLMNLDSFKNNFFEIFMFNHGGLVWYGGLLGSLIALFFYTKRNKISFLLIADLFAPYVALGHAFGRFGCFFRGCCYGKPTVSIFGLYFPALEEKLIPIQLVAALDLLLIMAFLIFLSKRITYRGGLFFVYLMLSSFARFFEEFFRGDSEIAFFGLTGFQISSVLIFALAAISLLYARARSNKISVSS